MLSLRASSTKTDMPFVCAWEEVNYERGLRILIDEMMTDEI